jgi:hypothetical protein
LFDSQLIEPRAEPVRNQEKTLHPGIFGQIRRGHSHRSLHIIEDRQELVEQPNLSGSARLGSLLAHMPPIIHEVSLRSPVADPGILLLFAAPREAVVSSLE